jgi:hypothetical protein
VVVLVAVCAALAFGADAKPAAPAKTAPKGEPASFLGGRDIGLIINMVTPFIMTEAADGVNTGLGMKLWLSDRSVVRGLVDFTLQTAGGTTDMTFGLSAAYEYHLATGTVSPYLGGVLGTQIVTGAGANMVLFFGGLLGAEVKIIDSVSFFAEYILRFEMDEPTFTIDLGIGNNTLMGIIIYL